MLEGGCDVVMTRTPLFGPQGEHLISPELPLCTRKQTPIPNEMPPPRLPVQMRAGEAMHLRDHPNIQSRSLRSEYNCMGMIFASRRTCVDPKHLAFIFSDDDYRPVRDQSALWPGDVVVYRDADDEIAHVGLISFIRPILEQGTREIWVISQWGFDGEYLHREDDVMITLGKPAEYWTDRP